MTLPRMSTALCVHVGNVIDGMFPPECASDEAYAIRCDEAWSQRRQEAKEYGVPRELSLPGKRWMYDQLVAGLSRAAGGSLAGLDIAEVGAGSGVGVLLAGREARSITVVDRSAAALEYAKTTAGNLGFADRARFIQADVLGTAGRTGPLEVTLDLVFSSGLIEHFSFPAAVEILRTKARMVRPGGVVVTYVPRLLSPCMLWRMAATRSKGNERFMTQRLLRALHDEAGLPGSRTCRFPSPLPAEVPVGIMKTAAALTRPFPWVDQLFGRSVRLERGLRDVG